MNNPYLVRPTGVLPYPTGVTPGFNTGLYPTAGNGIGGYYGGAGPGGIPSPGVFRKASATSAAVASPLAQHSGVSNIIQTIQSQTQQQQKLNVNNNNKPSMLMTTATTNNNGFGDLSFDDGIGDNDDDADHIIGVGDEKLMKNNKKNNGDYRGTSVKNNRNKNIYQRRPATFHI